MSMTDKPIAFRMCDFSEQFIPPTPEPGSRHHTYSVVAHVDGRVYQWRKAVHEGFIPPLAALRSEVWLALLEQIAEGK